MKQNKPGLCDHCQKREGEHKWTMTVCADKRRRRPRWLCEPCDHTLNRFVLEFFNDPKVDVKMAEYTGNAEQWGEQSRAAPV